MNKHLPEDNYPVPLISDILHRLSGNSVSSTIDLTQAYHRPPTDERINSHFLHAQRNTTYVQKAPFGLQPLSSLFQRGMNRLLGDLPFVCNFIDDIVIFSKNRKEHAQHVKMPLED